MSKLNSLADIMLLNGIFPRYAGLYSIFTIITVLVNAIFVQTIFQFVTIISILGMIINWAL